jgi:hypothetical protein
VANVPELCVVSGEEEMVDERDRGVEEAVDEKARGIGEAAEERARGVGPTSIRTIGRIIEFSYF